MRASSLDPDRLLPAEPGVRAIARDLYSRIADSPILSPHGHVPASWLADDTSFADAADLLVTHDHYVVRLLHASGISLDALGRGDGSVDAREVWRALAANSALFAGTASAYWMRDTLETLFGIAEPLSSDNVDATFDSIGAALATPDFTARSLFARFGIEVLATTDDPLDDLAAHRALADDDSFAGRVLPTFRPDAYTDPEAPGFAARVEALVAATGGGSVEWGTYLAALETRREYFASHGAVSADHGVVEPFTLDLDPGEANRLLQGGLAGTLDAAGARALRGHLLFQAARMSVEDGLVMTLHPGVRRNHHGGTFARFGPDTGHDIPLRTEYTDNLRPLLEAFGLEPNLRLILFTVDETTFSREIAPLAGFYPSVYAGAPWWFLDAPDAIGRYRSAITETCGFYRTSGFIDDTRAFPSIPARHDAARRLDSGFLARLVAEGRVPLDSAERIADDLVDAIPRAAFKL